MPYFVWEAIADTPWWIYVLFAYCIRVGLLARKPRIIHAKYLLMLPFIFILLTVMSMCLTIPLTAYHALLWSSTMITGILLGWLQFRFRKIKAVPQTKNLYIPGTWSLLIILPILFIVKFYYFGSRIALDPEILMRPEYAPFFLILYGLFTGLFIGRSIYSLRCLKNGPYVVMPG